MLLAWGEEEAMEKMGLRVEEEGRRCPDARVEGEELKVEVEKREEEEQVGGGGRGRWKTSVGPSSCFKGSPRLDPTEDYTILPQQSLPFTSPH